MEEIPESDDVVFETTTSNNVEFSRHLKYIRKYNRRATMSDISVSKPDTDHQAAAPVIKERRSNSIGDGDDFKRTMLRHHNSWPSNHSEAGSPRGPIKSHLAKMKEDTPENNNVTDSNSTSNHGNGQPDDDCADDTMPPSPERQRQIITSLDGECTCTYAVAKLWYTRWEEYVGVPKNALPGGTDPPGAVEMDAHNDGNNEYVSEDAWRRLVRWYGVSATHQLDRKHLYFKDEKMFDVCILSPFSGIVEHNIKKFNRFEEIGYIECQLRRIFHVPDYKKSRLWISEKAQVPRFRQLLLRFRMLNDCIHRDKVYILALEECNGTDSWPTGEPGEPKGDLSKYKDLISGPVKDEDLSETVDALQVSVAETVRRTVEEFLQNGKEMMREKEAVIDKNQAVLERKLEHAVTREEKVTDRETEAEKREQSVEELKVVFEQERKEFEHLKEKFQEELKLMESLHEIQEKKIKLDVGGQIFTTSIQTLRREPDSMLAAMFSGRYELKKEPDGSYFIDRDGTYFRYILNFLRDGALEAGTVPNDSSVIKELLREARYYQLSALVEYIEGLLDGFDSPRSVTSK